MTIKDDRLKAHLKDLRENAEENRKQAEDATRTGDHKRAAQLAGGAEALDYAARRLSDILNGKDPDARIRAIIAKAARRDLDGANKGA